MNCLFDDVSYLSHEYLYSKYGHVQRKIIGVLGSGIFGGSFETRGDVYVLKGYANVVFLTVDSWSFSFHIQKREVMGYSSLSGNLYHDDSDAYVNCCGTSRHVKKLVTVSNTSYFNPVMISQAEIGFSLAISALKIYGDDIEGSRKNVESVFVGKWDQCVCDEHTFSASYSCSGRFNNVISSFSFSFGVNDVIPSFCSLDDLQSCCINTVYSLDKIKKIIGG